MANKYMTVAEQINWIDVAITLTVKRINTTNDVDLYNMILCQLEYILSCLNDNGSSRGRLSDINIGQLAVREFEQNDEEYCDALKKSYFIVHYMMGGLKVPVIDNRGNIVR